MSKPHKSITAQDVANHAGVSRAVVSRALSDKGSIAPETKTKVIAAARELGYQVNFLAQGLNRKRSQLIGVVVARIKDPFRSSLLEGLIHMIQRRGYQALVTEVNSEKELEATMRQFTQFRVSGVIVTSGQPPATLVNECVQFKIPVVGINRQLDIPLVDFVCSDNQQGAALATDQLLKSGCHSFAWLNYAGSTWAGVQRGVAFEQALESANFGANSVKRVIAEQDGYEGGEAAALAFDLSQGLPNGVFCANAQLACGFLDGMRQRGFDAPNDFHLIGFDNTPQTAQYSYRLTTLNQDISALCSEALNCLESRNKSPNQAARLVRVPVSLVLRHTSPVINLG